MIELDVLSAADVAAEGQPTAWRSRAHKEGAPGYERLINDEFHPDSGVGEEEAGPDRRTFLKVMGASVAMAGLTGCRRPVEHIAPYARKPEAVVPGVPNYYATARPQGGVVFPVVVQSHEGRPTKIEGNPGHPVSQGATDVFTQASILNLYDPDRSRFVYEEGRRLADDGWARFAAAARTLRAGAAGRRLAVLAEPSSSPTRARLRAQIEAAFPGTTWIDYEPVGDAAAQGLQAAVGSPLRPRYNLAEADVIVSFDADFTSPEHPASVELLRGLSASRNVEARGRMSRLYVVESQMSVTGGMADHRRRLRASDIPLWAAAVAGALGTGPSAREFADDPMVAAIAADVQAAGGTAVFLAGPTQPPAVHALCAALNGTFGASVTGYYDTGAASEAPQGERLVGLVRAMQSGQVDTLLMLGTNPVYSLPAELEFAEALERVDTSIHLGLHRDETGQRATWHVPAAHYLEQWGDGRAYDGSLCLIQPLIAPLYADAHSEIEVAGLFANGQDLSGYDLVRETLRASGTVGGPFEDGFRTLLHDGFLPGSGYAPVSVAASAPAASEFASLQRPAEGEIELVTRLSPKVYDGRFANNAWMQETPHPVTKLTWDNVAIMSPATAEALDVDYTAEEIQGEWDVAGAELEDGQLKAAKVTLTAPGGAAVELPVWVQPGHPDGSVTVALGYGRSLETDRIVRERTLLQRLGVDLDKDIYRPGPLAGATERYEEVTTIGANVAPLRPASGANVLPVVAVEKTDDGYLLATTQDHGMMAGRAIVRQATVTALAADYEARAAVPEVEDIPYQEYPPLWGAENSADADVRISEAMYSENQWGMAIDLNSCNGCNACLVACQSENNIQVVGKDQVSRGREMHWIRLDRYYVGDADDPQMVVQPMLCQHCEYAPCESVCPVAATVHSPDGMNMMVYNRCIGTRYCSNNCPYKVRRFNFYNWTKTLPIEVQMAQNPNVTVRFRGVMEKCQFCVQRVRRAQQYAHIEDVELPADSVQTACQQVCPAQAITFGDLNDENSEVARIRRENARTYELLAELNVKPRVSYLARVRNPSPLLAAPVAAEGPEEAAA